MKGYGLPSEGVVHPPTEWASQTGAQAEQTALDMRDEHCGMFLGRE